MASDAYRHAINNTPGRSYVWMTINHGSTIPSKVVIELFDEYCPKTCENFKELCKGYKKSDSLTIGYKGSELHRVVKGMYL